MSWRECEGRLDFFFECQHVWCRWCARHRSLFVFLRRDTRDLRLQGQEESTGRRRRSRRQTRPWRTRRRSSLSRGVVFLISFPCSPSRRSRPRHLSLFSSENLHIPQGQCRLQGDFHVYIRTHMQRSLSVYTCRHMYKLDVRRCTRQRGRETER